MNVLLVSQCSKNALKETRRILDQFAERRGERTWQTPITQAGLDTLRRLLRRSARRNTAVACHWIRGRDHSELLWIVGDAGRFNARGAVPTQTTRRDILRRADENDWHTGEDILLLSSLAALLHDLGKACAAFQRRLLDPAGATRNVYRHEWISLRLFEAFVAGDDDATWLARLAELDADDGPWLERLVRDGLDDGPASPFSSLPPLAAAVGWLIVTHHRLPVMPRSADDSGFQAAQLRDLPALITADWNDDVVNGRDPRELPGYWRFDHPLPVTTRRWRNRAAHLAGRMRRRLDHYQQPWLDNPYVMHLARLSLMLADHHYSSLEDPGQRTRGEPGYPLYANTVRRTGALNQPLDEHLLGVEAGARRVSGTLPGVERYLPRLARHRGFRRRSADPRFRWQDRAYDLAASLRERSQAQGFFGVNMASTGCGKTLANGRILYALADPDGGARFSIALGLRTLTLQTGRAYRTLMNLGDDELAVRTGGAAGRALFEHFEAEADASGSASSQRLMEEDAHVYFEGDFGNHPLLRQLAHDPGMRALIAAPILACTVDHLVPATDGLRGGRQIAPMLRLLSGDLVLDEVDDFDLDDLPALTRLVNWAGMLGTRVLLSSATLAPSLVEGLYQAYRAGRAVYQRNRGEPGRAVNIACAWFDESDRRHADCPDAASFTAAHEAFAGRRRARLAEAAVRRRAALVPVPASRESGAPTIAEQMAAQMRRQALELHQRHHSVDPRSGRRVSFGLIRMANIEPLVQVARALLAAGAPEGHRIHLCVYHAQFPLVMRSTIERHLDGALDRRDEMAVFERPEVRACIDGADEPDQLFVVLGSPVTEVGRDHDYDWAVVEPSSMRSLIQLAGRVRRHRVAPCETANIALLAGNYKAMETPGNVAFTHPGFEGAARWRLSSHDLHELLAPDEYEVVDSRPRITERGELRPRDSLVDLEHARLRAALLPGESGPGRAMTARERRAMKAPPTPPLNAASWYGLPRADLSGVLQRKQPFRRQTREEVELVLMPDDAGEHWHLRELWHEPGRRGAPLYLEADGRLERTTLEGVPGERITPWIGAGYLDALAALAEDLDQPLEACARQFGVVTVPQNDQGWCYADALGFTRRR
ncbi:type I-F CRISPR-associated helicase Cas3f [Arhodomonas aquaeolei]|uniref:type I-F CRISPR-associated helicase Cas3f n=1 Tax=Arhodomonas aquaeolei TaxID=2369 RepID=UPI0003724F73|nr:type I-F CRISPR-associated helicase Cas3f [Arhodomonas aquaeolei]